MEPAGGYVQRPPVGDGGELVTFAIDFKLVTLLLFAIAAVLLRLRLEVWLLDEEDEFDGHDPYDEERDPAALDPAGDDRAVLELTGWRRRRSSSATSAAPARSANPPGSGR